MATHIMTRNILEDCRRLLIGGVFVSASVPLVVGSHPRPRDCPRVSVECDAHLPEAGKIYTVKVRIEGENVNRELSYNWSVSSGEIVEGQGTSSLKIRIIDPDKTVTATVEVNGLDLSCARTASCSSAVY